MELWDALDCKGQKLGYTLVRGTEIPQGVCHAVVCTLVRHIGGDFLLMQRDLNKETYPGCFEATAGGSVKAGETLFAAAKRELYEETGIVSDIYFPLDAIVATQKHTIYHTYLCVTDCDKSSVTLQDGETISYKWLSFDEFKAFCASDDCIKSQITDFGKYYRSIGIM